MSDGARLNKVDSEIALTALLSAAVMGYPKQDLSVYPEVQLVAVGLLVLTLARRTGTINGLTGEDTVIKATSYLMDPATYISFLYLSYVVISWLTNVIAPGSDPSAVVFGGGTALLVFVSFLASELIFGAALGEGERIFAASARQHRGEAFGALLTQIAAFVDSRGTDNVTRQTELSRFHDRNVEDYSPEEQVRVVKSVLVMVLGVLISVIGYALLAVVGTYVFGVGLGPVLLLLLAVVLVSAFFRIWYSNYGLVQVEHKNGYVSFLGDAVTFLVVGLMVV